MLTPAANTEVVVETVVVTLARTEVVDAPTEVVAPVRGGMTEVVVEGMVVELVLKTMIAPPGLKVPPPDRSILPMLFTSSHR